MSKVYKSPAIRLSENDASDPMKRIQILRVGDFHHSRYGNFKITTKMLSEMVKNFTEGVRGITPALDYGHDSEGVAAGWFKKLWLSEDGTELWAEVELTPVAVQKLSDKEYGYVSAEFDPAYETNETPKKKVGAVLLGAGLTNRPVIKKMQPVIELSEGGTMDVKELEEKLKATETKLAECEDKLKKMADMAGVDDIEKIMELIASSKKAPEMETELADTKKALSEKSDALKLAEEKLAEKEKEMQFTVMLSEGKVCLAQKEAFMKGDMVEFAKNAQAMNLSENGHGKTPKDDGVDPEEKILELATKMAEEKKIMLSEAIYKVRKENPELVKKLKEIK